MNFDIEWLYDTYIIECWHIISVIGSVMMIYYLFLKAQKTRLFYNYLILHGFLLIWMICKILKTIAPDSSSKWVFIVVQYLAICFFGSAFIVFSYQYSYRKSIPKKIFIALIMISSISFLFILLNPLHYLFYSSYDFLGDTFGPYFYIHSIITYTFFLIGIIICFKNFSKNFNEKKIQTRLISTAIFIPIFINILYIADVFEPRFDITPITANISLLIFAYAIFKQRFLNIEPIGIQKALDVTDEAILILDSNFNLLEKNRAADRIVIKKNEEVKENQIKKRILSLINSTLTNKNNTKQEIMYNNNYYLITKKELLLCKKTLFKSKNNQLINNNYIVVIKDITEYKKIQNKLEEYNIKLLEKKIKLENSISDAKVLIDIEKRKRLAREAHDIIGHTLVVTKMLIKNLISMKDITNKNIDNEIIKIKESLLNGYNELSRSSNINNTITNIPIIKLKIDLGNLTKKILNIQKRIDISINNNSLFIPNKIYNIIFRICQEGITNSLKHSNGNEIYIIIRNRNNLISLDIIDNGKIKSNFKKGNGIKGIEQRVLEIGGFVNIRNIDGGGFAISVSIPFSMTSIVNDKTIMSV